MTHPLDQALLSATPLLPVPLFGDLQPLETNGHRFLVGRNGLFIEVKRPWFRAIWPVSGPVKAAIPYGQITPKVEFAFGALPVELLQQFVRDAREVFPNEAAAWLIFNEHSKRLHYRLLEHDSVTPDCIQYRTPPLLDGEHLAVDLHSHGGLGAFFSSTDDADDAGSFKVAGVIGHVDREEPSASFRLCIGGMFVNVPFHGFSACDAPCLG